MKCPIFKESDDGATCVWKCRDCDWSATSPAGVTRRRSCDRKPKKPPEPATYILTTLDSGNVQWGCRACDWTYEGHRDDKIEHVCGEKEPRSIWNWGNSAEAVLKTFGITEERVAYIMGILRDAPTCNCAERKEAMNRIGQEFGAKVQFALNLLWSRKHG